MDVSENSGFSPQIIHFILIGFSIIFTIHFGGNTPIFGNTHIYPIHYLKVGWPFPIKFSTGLGLGSSSPKASENALTELDCLAGTSRLLGSFKRKTSHGRSGGG